MTLNPQSPDFYLKESLAVHVGVSIQTINRWIACGAIKTTKIAGRRLVPANQNFPIKQKVGRKPYKNKEVVHG